MANWIKYVLAALFGWLVLPALTGAIVSRKR